MTRNMFTENQTLEAILKSLASYGNKVVEKKENEEEISVRVKCDHEVYMHITGGYFVQCANHFYNRISDAFPGCTNHKCIDIISSKSLGDDRISLTEESVDDLDFNSIGQLFLTDTGNGIHSYFYSTTTNEAQTSTSSESSSVIAPFVAASFVCGNNEWLEKVEKLLGTILDALWESVCYPDGFEGENGVILKCGYDKDSTLTETMYIKICRCFYEGKEDEYITQLADISVTHISPDSFAVDAAIDAMNCYDLDNFKNESVSVFYKHLSCAIYSMRSADRNHNCQIQACQALDAVMLERAKLVVKSLAKDNLSSEEIYSTCKNNLRTFCSIVLRPAIIEILNSMPQAIHFSMPLRSDVFADVVRNYDREEAVIANIQKYAEHFNDLDYYTRQALATLDV